MAPMRALAVLFVVALTLVGCSKSEPEVDPVAQVPADQRPETGASEGGSEGGGGEGGGGAEFVAVDIAFESAPESVPAGDLEVTLKNDGAAQHDVTFEEPGDVTVASANGGETASGTITLEAGTVTYYCSIPGHRDAGMEGTLTVE